MNQAFPAWSAAFQGFLKRISLLTVDGSLITSYRYPDPCRPSIHEGLEGLSDAGQCRCSLRDNRIAAIVHQFRLQSLTAQEADVRDSFHRAFREQ